MKLEGQVRIPSGCAISAVISREGRRMTGEDIIRSMVPMHDRSNGLGGGFAAYGIYPEHREEYAFHIFFDDNTTRRECEAMLKEGFELVDAELIPIRIIPEITDIPHIWRYFVRPLNSVLARLQLDEKEFVARTVMDINTKLKGAYVFSSGKNMGTFKAVGYPEDVGRFYRLEEYEGYSWTAHGRYPTNTPGWWGGAHPFSLLDWSIVHNGEISSYDANRRCIEMYGYKCNLQTDTEVITYIADYLLRRQGLTLTPGDFLDEAGRVLGRHRGLPCYTIGQGKGLGVAVGRHVYVLEKDRDRNAIVLGDDAALYASSLLASHVNWISGQIPAAPVRCAAKTRYSQVETPCTAYPLPDGGLRVVFDQPQRAITAGQAVVLYDGDEVLGGGTIEKSE